MLIKWENKFSLKACWARGQLLQTLCSSTWCLTSSRSGPSGRAPILLIRASVTSNQSVSCCSCLCCKSMRTSWSLAVRDNLVRKDNKPYKIPVYYFMRQLYIIDITWFLTVVLIVFHRQGYVHTSLCLNQQDYAGAIAEQLIKFAVMSVIVQLTIIRRRRLCGWRQWRHSINLYKDIKLN